MAEKRLIDANALDTELETLMVRFAALGRKRVAEDYNFVRTVLATAITVDAVEVVRCGKCKSRPKGEYGMCHKLCRQTHEDDFCSYGERRTDG